MEFGSGTDEKNISETCNNFDTSDFIVVAACRSISGFISFFGSLFVICLILLYKKYLFFTQRLILYLSIASMLNGLSVGLQGAVYFPQTTQFKIYCAITGFLDQTTIWSTLLAIGGITLDIYFKAVLNRKNRWEIFYILVIFIFPFSFNWIPLIDSTYGLAGPWCWIKKYRSKNDCSTYEFGEALRYILYFIPVYAFVIALIITYIIIYIYIRKQRHRYHGNFDPERENYNKMMKKEVVPLIWYPIIYLILLIPPTVNRIADTVANELVVPLWYIHALLSPLQGGLICIVYAMDPETRQRLSKCNIHTYIVTGRIDEYPTIRGETDSITESNRDSYFKEQQHLLTSYQQDKTS